jgi:hypothetical protein
VPNRGPSLAAVAADPRLLDVVPPERVGSLLRECSALALALVTRLPEPQAPEPERKERPVRWLTAREIGALAGLTVRQVRSLSRRKDWAPFTRRLSRRTTRFEESGVRDWLGNGQGKAMAHAGSEKPTA